MGKFRSLVIGLGNTLRGDDGAGPAAAEMLRSFGDAGVRVRVVHQLTPELIDEMKDSQRVLFIDASVSAGDARIEWRRLEPRQSCRALGHHQPPENLLALLQDLEGHVPEAWVLTLPGMSFHHGEGLTPMARESVSTSMASIREWLAEDSCTKSA